MCRQQIHHHTCSSSKMLRFKVSIMVHLSKSHHNCKPTSTRAIKVGASRQFFEAFNAYYMKTINIAVLPVSVFRDNEFLDLLLFLMLPVFLIE
jgi:hypothetical protein